VLDEASGKSAARARLRGDPTAGEYSTRLDLKQLEQKAMGGVAARVGGLNSYSHTTRRNDRRKANSIFSQFNYSKQDVDDQVKICLQVVKEPSATLNRIGSTEVAKAYNQYQKLKNDPKIDEESMKFKKSIQMPDIFDRGATDRERASQFMTSPATNTLNISVSKIRVVKEIMRHGSLLSTEGSKPNLDIYSYE